MTDTKKTYLCPEVIFQIKFTGGRGDSSKFNLLDQLIVLEKGSKYGKICVKNSTKKKSINFLDNANN